VEAQHDMHQVWRGAKRGDAHEPGIPALPMLLASQRLPIIEHLQFIFDPLQCHGQWSGD
jgi:hypothetical protein